MPLEPVLVPEGECGMCPWRQNGGIEDPDFCAAAPASLDAELRGGVRPSWCPLGTMAAIRWVPEVVGASPEPRGISEAELAARTRKIRGLPDPDPTVEVARDELLKPPKEA